MFQNTVRDELGLGVVGEFYADGPRHVEPFTLDSAAEANNVIGRVFTVKSEGVAQAGGDDGVFAGIMVNPKSYVVEDLLDSDSDLTLKNGASAELCRMGIIIIEVPEAANIGDALNYNDTTGVIGVGAPAAGETAIPNAKITHFTATGAGLAVVTLTN